jgi:hypothetical protein
MPATNVELHRRAVDAFNARDLGISEDELEPTAP